MWARAGRSISAEYLRYGNALRAMAALAPPPGFLHIFSQPRTPEFLAAQESFARDHAWFHVRRLDALSHFAVLEEQSRLLPRSRASQRTLGSLARDNAACARQACTSTAVPLASCL